MEKVYRAARQHQLDTKEATKMGLFDAWYDSQFKPADLSQYEFVLRGAYLLSFKQMRDIDANPSCNLRFARLLQAKLLSLTKSTEAEVSKYAAKVHQPLKTFLDAAEAKQLINQIHLYTGPNMADDGGSGQSMALDEGSEKEHMAGNNKEHMEDST